MLYKIVNKLNVRKVIKVKLKKILESIILQILYIDSNIGYGYLIK